MKKLSLVLLLSAMSLVVGCKKNQIPDQATIPSGPTSGHPGATLVFTSSATDPDDDSVTIRFDWGDGDTSAWSTRLPSGGTATDSHSWASADTYRVRAQTRDNAGLETDWSVPLAVAILPGWMKTIGGSTSDYCDEGVLTPDGGYVVTGHVDNNTDLGRALLLKTDSLGNVVWNLTYGDSGCYNWGRSVQQASDGGYVVAGQVSAWAVCLMKTDADGNQTWTKTYGGTGENNDALSVKKTSDGGYIVTGVVEDVSVPDRLMMYLVKTDAGGNEVWSKSFGSQGTTVGYSVLQAADGGYVVLGRSDSSSRLSAMWLVKTDANGYAMWTRTFEGTDHPEGHDIQPTSDGGYIIVGTARPAGDIQAYLLKINASGDTLWSRTYGGTVTEQGFSVQQTADGGYILTGYAWSYGSEEKDVYLVKTNPSGDTLWTRTFGGPGHDVGQSIRQTPDGGYVIAATTESFGAGGSDIWLIKTDAQGNAAP